MEQVAEKIFDKAFELFAKGLKEGIPELEIPPLDPLEIPGREEIELESFVAYLAASFFDVKVTGLSTLDKPKVEQKDGKIEATVTTKPVEVKGNYTLNGHAVKLLSIAADSDFTCTIVSIKLTVGLEMTDKKTGKYDPKVHPKVHVEVKFEDMKLTLNGLNDAGKIVGKLVNSLLSKLSGLISKFLQKAIGEAMQRGLQKVVDKCKDEFGAEIEAFMNGVQEATAEIKGAVQDIEGAVGLAAD